MSLPMIGRLLMSLSIIGRLPMSLLMRECQCLCQWSGDCQCLCQSPGECQFLCQSSGECQCLCHWETAKVSANWKLPMWGNYTLISSPSWVRPQYFYTVWCLNLKYVWACDIVWATSCIIFWRGQGGRDILKCFRILNIFLTCIRHENCKRNDHIQRGKYISWYYYSLKSNTPIKRAKHPYFNGLYHLSLFNCNKNMSPCVDFDRSWRRLPMAHVWWRWLAWVSHSSLWPSVSPYSATSGNYFWIVNGITLSNYDKVNN